MQTSQLAFQQQHIDLTFIFHLSHLDIRMQQLINQYHKWLACIFVTIGYRGQQCPTLKCVSISVSLYIFVHSKGLFGWGYQRGISNTPT